MTFQAACPRNAEDLLARELRSCGAQSVDERPVTLTFTGTLETAYRACLWSRLATRVLLPLARFRAATPDELREGVRAVGWEEHLDLGTTFAVSATVTQSALTHSLYASQLVKDGLADHFRDRTGERPSVDRHRPGVRLHLHLNRDEATLSLNLSGESLHRRGYRERQGPAPLKENVAAALLLRGMWDRIAPEAGAFLDPMCGSGTIVLEAALIALGRAPGLGRTHFGFESWKGHDAALWRRLTLEARERGRRGRDAPIVGYDADPEAVRNARANAQAAELDDVVRFEVRKLEACHPPSGRPGLVAVNPPYGERMGTVEELRPLYRDLGRVLRERFGGWRVALLTGESELAFATGLRAYRVNKLFNGPIPCEIALFTIRPRADTPVASDAAPSVDEPAPSRPEAPPPRRRVVVRRSVAKAATPGAEEGVAKTGQVRGEERGEAYDFERRLRRNVRLLGAWAEVEGVSSYRLYDTDLPQYAVAIDLYEGRWAHVQEYAAPAEIEPERARRRLEDVVRIVPAVLGLRGEDVYVKERRRQKGGQRYQRLATRGERHEVREGGLRFHVNFTDYLDTGLFLDHRVTRSLIRDMAAGTAFLNLFCYTGTATVYAAAGGATRTVSVDTSRTYLDWARNNLELNGYRGGTHELVRADARDFLRSEAESSAGRFGLVFIDPPTYSNTSGDRPDFSVQAEHVDLIRAAAALLEPHGRIVFSTNYRRLRLDQAALGELSVVDISARTIPKDFARNPRVHRAWLISRRPEGRTVSE